jgi:hypothetical protein
MSLSFRPDEQRADERQRQSDRGGPSFDDDRIPFAPEVR